jgi:hypothetical protein
MNIKGGLIDLNITDIAASEWQSESAMHEETAQGRKSIRRLRLRPRLRRPPNLAKDRLTKK